MCLHYHILLINLAMKWLKTFSTHHPLNKMLIYDCVLHLTYPFGDELDKDFQYAPPPQQSAIIDAFLANIRSRNDYPILPR